MTPITTTAELAGFCDKLKGQPFVAVDTEFMRETTYWPMLRERLEREGRLAWVTDEMAGITDPANYDVEPENAWRRLRPRKHTAKYLAVYKAVAAWRERTAQLRDQPRGRILKDEAIDELAAQAPTDAQALDRLRGVPKGFS